MKTIAGIQYLRGLAAFLVLYFHAIDQLPALFRSLGPFGHVGVAGVDIFFVISGFIMWTITAGGDTGDGRGSPMGFLGKRIVRIVPLYWVFTALSVAIAVAVPQALHNRSTDPWHILASFLFVPSFHPAFDHMAFPVLVPGWSLQFEMFFYLVFALFVSCTAVVRMVAVPAVMLGLVLAGIVIRPTGAIGVTYTDPLMVEFLAGMMLGVLHRAGRLRSLRLGWAGVLAFPLLVPLLTTLVMEDYAVSGSARLVAWGLPAVLLVAGVLCLENRGRVRTIPLFRLIGDASYSLYLSHLFTLGVLRAAWKAAGLPMEGAGGDIAFAVVACALGVAVAVGVYRLVERPLHDAVRWGIARGGALLPLPSRQRAGAEGGD